MLYVPDLDYFEKNDQFYIDYNEMPGIIVKEESKLCDAIVHAEDRFDRDKMQRFKAKYMNACDGHAVEKLVHYLQLS